MQFHILSTLLLLLPITLAISPRGIEAEERAYVLAARALFPNYNLFPNQARAVSQLVPTSYTTSRSANTEIAPPTTVGTANPSATTETTTHTANTQIIPVSGSGTATPLITSDSRSANTEAVGPSTVPSSAIAPGPTMLREAAMGAAVVVGLGMGVMA